MNSLRGGLVAAAAVIAAGVGLIPSAQAASITVFDTGVDAGGVSRSDGSTPDLHYTLNGGNLQTEVGTSTGGFPIGPWLGDSNTSAWIGPLSTARFAGANGATFDYQTTFNLTGLNPATALISGRWSTDDQGVDILINGVSTGQTTPPSSYASWTSFIINSGFVPGLNTLDFLVFNANSDCCGDPAGTNPTGVRVEMAGTADLSAVPLPSTWTMMLAGLGIVAVLACRRRRQDVVAAFA
jgi:PEP-CTERM motif-containing protein